MNRFSCLLSILLIIISLSCYSEVWTSKDGRTVDAEFVKVEKGRVWLRLGNGREMSAPFQTFIEEDQIRIKALFYEAEEKEKQAREAERAAFLAAWPPGETVKRTTSGDVKATYHVYIPTSFDPDNPPPLLYAFSPGGNGRGQLNKMRSSAEKVGWIVVGCDQLKNGMEHDVEEALEDAILADVLAEVPHDVESIFLSGFSGGAMRCYGISSRREELNVKGILAFGGWIGGKDVIKELDFPKGMVVAMINGDSDKGANAWSESDGKVLEKDGCEVEVFRFPGGHTMPSPEVIDEAIAWMMSEINP